MLRGLCALRSLSLAGRAAAATVITLACAAVLLKAQAPQATGSRPAAASAAPLPVTRVVLYKTGIGYFEHVGKVRGNQNVTVDFTSGQLDDVLASLTTIDLDGGRVLGVSYNSQQGLDRQLGALRLPLGMAAGREDLLRALRGTRVEVRGPTSTVTGRLLSVDAIERAAGGAVTHTEAVSVVTDGGDIETIALDPGVNVRIADADLNQEVGRYLSLVGSARDQDVRRLTFATSGTGDRDLFVSYVSEVPVWKATYRLVLPAAGDTRKPLLQGWAIVDNTVGEDWENVELSLVAGAPQSFIQQISRPYYVQRPIVPLPERMLLAPQTHASATAIAGPGVLTGTVTDSAGGVIPGATARISRAGQVVATAATDASGRYRATGLTPGPYSVSITLAGFQDLSYAGVNVSGGMETVLNGVLEIGSMAEAKEITASVGLSRASTVANAPPPAAPRAPGGGGGSGGGRGGGFAGGVVGGIAADRLDAVAMQAAAQSDATAGQLGDLFEYKLKDRVTIRKNQSALVPILSGEISAEKVSLWTPNSPGGVPLRAVWVTNGTGLTLDGGNFSVVDGQAFAGEGLMDSLKPGERRLLSYAADVGLKVDAKGEPVPTRIASVQISRGVVIQRTEDHQRRVYTARNEDTEPRALVVEHPVRPGWTIGGTLAPAETTPTAYRFRLTVAPKTTATFTVDETRPLQTQYSVDSVTNDQIAVLARNQLVTEAVAEALRKIMAQKAEVARLDGEIARRGNEVTTIGQDQDRIRENMKALRGSSEERQLLQRYVKQLNDGENRLDELKREQQSLAVDRDKARAELTRMITSLQTEPSAT